MTAEPILWLRGERVALGPTYAELIEEYWRWENDPVAVNGYGLATEATRLTLDYAFHLTALAQVWLKVLEPNTAAIRAYEHAGFHLAGRLRQAGYWHGQRCDELLMDALPTDFPGPSAFTHLSLPPG